MRIMGLDFGSKTVGVAISDELLLTAQGKEIIRRKEENKLRQTLARIEELIVEYNVEEIVLGLPKNMNGTLGPQAQDCMNFADVLKQRLSHIDFIFEDERLTSRQAENILAMQGKKYTKNKGMVDLKSACIILQQYLDRK